MIELRAASRWYGEVIGLNDVTATIGPGVTALLGQNGAGKSTMMRLITGQLRPTTGEVLVDGQSPYANPEVYKVLGYCPDVDGFYEGMSGRAFVRHMARLAGFSSSQAIEKTEDALVRVGMSDRADRKIAGYSKGMRQRIKLAQAMIHDPKAILLDEPLNGLDPVARREFMQMIGTLAAEGRSVIVSSHILHEVERLTHRILLLHRGRLLAAGDMETIRALIDRYPQRIRVTSTEPERVARELVALPGVVSLRLLPAGGIELECRTPDAFFAELPKRVVEANLPITELARPDNNLESVYRYLVTG